MQFSRINFEGNILGFPVDPDKATNTGLRAGLAIDIPVTGNFSVQPGIYYAKKGGQLGASYTDPGSGITGNGVLDFKLSYLDIPVMLMYHHGIGPGRIFAGLGPNIGIGISGKSDIRASVFGFPVMDSTADVDFGDKEEELKRMDFGGNINLGYELPMGLFARASYTLGFSNISNLDDTEIKNRGGSITVGYFFSRKPRTGAAAERAAD